jgi:hypothetical protein
MQAGAAEVTAARSGGSATGTRACSASPPTRVGCTFRPEATVLREKSVEAITQADRAGAGSRGAPSRVARLRSERSGPSEG